MKISWLDIPDRIEFELIQLRDEGNDVADASRQWEILKSSGSERSEFHRRAEKFYDGLERDFPCSPMTADGQSFGDDVRETPAYSPSFLENRILGGWLGRAAGCLLGKPVEKIPRHAIKEMLVSNGTWPLAEFITERGIPNSLLHQYPWNKHSGRESLRENIVCMTEDDDLNYSMLNLYVLEKYGSGFASEDIARTWLELMPLLSTFTAERVAYVNSLNGLDPPHTALRRNPYREWIGAQIRADLWGWVSPGQPARAAEFASRDARISHVRNGIYGERFFAAMVAASFDDSNIRSNINTALNCVPTESRLAEAVRFVLSLPIDNVDWETTLDRLYEKYDVYHWVHTINNAALVVAALLSSRNDFERAICNVVMGGWDTDSNGATVGSIMGTMLGADNLPTRWTRPLQNRIRSSLKGFDNSTFTDLAHRTLKVAQFRSTDS